MNLENRCRPGILNPRCDPDEKKTVFFPDRAPKFFDPPVKNGQLSEELTGIS